MGRRLRLTRRKSSRRPEPGIQCCRALIVLAEYDPQWPALFEAEAARIQQQLGDLARRIEHVGSTAIPGMTAKPVIDIQVSVTSLQPIGVYEERLGSLGYAHLILDDFDRVYPYFRRPAQWPSTHHVHLCEAGGALEARHIRFRDYLRTHADAAAEYVRLKQTLAALHHGETHESRESYSLGKTEFVERVLQLAGWD